MQVAVELYNAFKAETSSRVGGCSVFKWVDVVFDCFYGNTTLSCSLSEEFWVVDTLGSWGNLFSAHEEVVGVCVSAVVGVNHSVEWSSTHRVSVKHVEVSVEFISHNFAKSLLSFRWQVLKWVLLDSCLMQKFDSFLEVKLKHWVSALEFLEWILLINHSELLGMPCLDSFEHKDH